MDLEIVEILSAMNRFNGLCCELSPDITDFSKTTEEEIILRGVQEGNKFAIRTDITEIYTVLNMEPFPSAEIAYISWRSFFGDGKKEGVNDTPEACKAWLENIYKTIEREAWRQGKLELHYKKEKWFQLYQNPPQHLKEFLEFVSPKFVRLCRPHPKTIFELSNDKELADQISEEPEKFNTTFKDFVEISNKEEISKILVEGDKVIYMDPFPRDWFLLTLYSAAVYADVDDLRRSNFFSASNREFFNYLLTQLKQEAINQGKL